MTLDEAIRIQRTVLGKLVSDNYLKADEYPAFNMGVEALERERLFRERLIELKLDRDIIPLPSEEETK